MTNKQILNGNMLVANFMGDYFDTGLEPSYYIRKNMVYDIQSAHYHDSWDWLMPVIPKILGIGFTMPKFNLPMVNAQELFGNVVYKGLYYKKPESIYCLKWDMNLIKTI